MTKTDMGKLALWKERLERAQAAFEGEYAKMDRREATYRGASALRPMVPGDELTRTPHVRNVAAELIEAQVDTAIPQPRVTARRKADERLAQIIEDMLRGELDRLPMEVINDIQERTAPIQGAAFYLVEWDNTRRSHGTVGEVAVTPLHPRQVLPQEGVFTSIEDMDYIFLKLPQTREYLRRRYDVKLEEVRESEPEVRGAEDGTDSDMVTQYVVYFRNEEGGIGRFSWVDETVLEDMEDYQARRVDGEVQTHEEVFLPGMPPVRVPYYKPDIYPVIMQRNVSVFGQLLGDSDIDKIADQQNTINRLESKIIDKLMKAGSYITLPDEASIRFDAEDMKVIRPGSAAAKAMIDVYDLHGDIQPDLAYMREVYEEARQMIGITDSFQGRRDSTAMSGVAKQFAAAQSAGRLESKRVMKNAAYAELFEAIFRFRLAYADEPRPVTGQDADGEPRYEVFSRYDFLQRDSAGQWYWNDRFFFSCDAATPLANNREAMWQETRLNLQSGAFGDPTALETLLLFWGKMELLHYPGAGKTKAYLSERMRERREAAERAGREL